MKKTHYILENQLTKVIVEAVYELGRKDYKLKFRREIACLYCFELQQWIMPENFTVDESYHFEELLNPDKDRILYAISLSDGAKGFLIDSANVYMDNISQEMAVRLKKNLATELNSAINSAIE